MDNNPKNIQNESIPRFTGTFSLTGAGAFSVIIWVLYSLGVSRGYINAAPVKTDPTQSEKRQIEAFLDMGNQIDEIHEWTSHENRDGIPNWLLPQLNNTAIEDMSRRLERMEKLLDKMENDKLNSKRP